MISSGVQRATNAAASLLADEVLVHQERLAWSAYAQARFRPGQARAGEARAQFEETVAGAWDRLRRSAARGGRKVEFSVVRLKYLAVHALDSACPYCGKLFGVDDFGLVWDVPVVKGASCHAGLANVVVCCSDCTQAKGSLTGNEWLEFVAALRVADASRARELLTALIEGRKRRSGQTGKRYFPTPPGCG